MAKKQKVHSGGNDGNRYFWDITLDNGEVGVYRSRHTKKAGVISEFAKNGKTVKAVYPHFG